MLTSRFGPLTVRAVLMRTRAYWLFAATGFGELGILVLLSQTTVSPLGVAMIVGAVAWLGWGSRIAWGVFVAANAFALVTTPLLVLGLNDAIGATIWSSVIVICVGSAVLLAMLFSPAMRHTASHSRPSSRLTVGHGRGAR